MTLATRSNVQVFEAYLIGTIDKTNCNIIDLKDNDKKYMYLVIDKEFNTYYSTASIGGIKRYLNQLYGHRVTLKHGDKMHYICAGRFESLTPDNIIVSDSFGEIAKVQMYVNLTSNGLQAILRKEGVK